MGKQTDARGRPLLCRERKKFVSDCLHTPVVASVYKDISGGASLQKHSSVLTFGLLPPRTGHFYLCGEHLGYLMFSHNLFPN